MASRPRASPPANGLSPPQRHPRRKVGEYGHVVALPGSLNAVHQLGNLGAVMPDHGEALKLRRSTPLRQTEESGQVLLGHAIDVLGGEARRRSDTRKSPNPSGGRAFPCWPRSRTGCRTPARSGGLRPRSDSSAPRHRRRCQRPAHELDGAPARPLPASRPATSTRRVHGVSDDQTLDALALRLSRISRPSRGAEWPVASTRSRFAMTVITSRTSGSSRRRASPGRTADSPSTCAPGFRRRTSASRRCGPSRRRLRPYARRQPR